MSNHPQFIIRPLEPEDVVEIREIYRYYVEKTTVSFEYELPTDAEWLDRIRNIHSEYPWLVMEFKQKIVGYAYASKHRSRKAYNWSVESAVYIDQKYHGLGLGKVLYSALFDILRLQGYRNVYAGITLPNFKSVRLHESMGFSDVGVFRKIGYKFGAWLDTGWFHLNLSDSDIPPGILKSPDEVQSDPQYDEILIHANRLLNTKHAE